MAESPAGSRAHLPTEQRNERSRELDRMSAGDAFDVFQLEDEAAVLALRDAREDVLRAVYLIADRIGRGGRLFYVGAGTSGRLGVLDASELPPTFQCPPELVRGIIAGGDEALTRAVEGAEDSVAEARDRLDDQRLGPDDVVFGIAAGGTTTFVHAAIERAREVGAATVFFACVSADDVPDEADVSIRVVTGPEVLAGSTRLKAGTVTKLVLNRVSTLVMVRLGKVYENLMVDVDTRANRKLTQRGVGMLVEILGVDAERAAGLLEAADGRVKVAAVMHRHGASSEEACARLAACDGFLRAALADPEDSGA